jgi:CRP-like cAMP-binding protein
MSYDGPPIRNELLLRLAAGELALLGQFERVKLALRHSIEGPGVANPYVYFPEDGVVSVVFGESHEGATEIGLIGKEGTTALAAIYGDQESPFSIYVQLEGSALRCPMKNFEELMAASAPTRSLMMRYARAFSIQVASTAVTNGRGKLEERLARWFLMVSDRSGNTFRITHEFVSVMLAVRRSGVTLAIQSLEARGLIQASRGSVRIVDREGLIKASAKLYGVAETEYDRLLGIIAKTSSL